MDNVTEESLDLPCLLNIIVVKNSKSNYYEIIEQRFFDERVENILLTKVWSEARANKIVEFLKSGGAFSGFTPDFMLKGITSSVAKAA